ALVVVGTVLRLRQPSSLDLFLDAGAWAIAGLTLSFVVARAVFAPGRITSHRVVGAVLLYLVIGFTFTAFFCFVALLEPNAFAGLRPLQDNLAVASNFGYFSFVTLTSGRIRRHRPSTPIRSRLRQRGGNHRAALSGNAAGAACDARGGRPTTVTK